MLFVLSSCSNFDKEFTVYSANTTIEVYTDGSAFVSEHFDTLVKKAENYGGVYVDIPQRFTDGSGGVHWRDFELAAARLDGIDEYYSKENNVPGYSFTLEGNTAKAALQICPLVLQRSRSLIGSDDWFVRKAIARFSSCRPIWAACTGRERKRRLL